MENIKIEAKEREITGKKVKALRREGLLPGVMYGANTESVPLLLDAHDASSILAGMSGSTLVDLKIGKKTHKVLVREIQRDVIRRAPIHVDFLEVALDVLIKAVVPIELVGEAPAVSDYGGVLVTGVSEVEVEALPTDLPDRLSIELEGLEEIDDTLLVSDLVTGENVIILTDQDELVARVVYQVIEEIEEEEELVEELEEDMEPEVIERARADEEGEEEPAESE
jgi:large subunit ribosomal protein L25